MFLPVYAGYLVFGAACTFLWVYMLRNASFLDKLKDIPNNRSSHSVVVPRGAGLAFGVTTLAVGMLSSELRVWALCAFLISILGIFDDAYSLSARKRLALQFAICMAFALDFAMKSPLGLNAQILLVGTLVFLALSSINFYNFADGINAHVAVQALIATAAWTFLYAGEMDFSHLAPALSTLIGCLLLYLWANAYKRWVFMGDTGSTYLGFFVMTAFLPLGTESGQFSYITYFAASLAFTFIIIADCSLILLAKVYFGFPVFAAHRHHFYQQLSRRTGWGHMKSTTLLGLWQAAIAASFVAAVRLQSPAFAIVLALFAASYLYFAARSAFHGISELQASQI